MSFCLRLNLESRCVKNSRFIQLGLTICIIIMAISGVMFYSIYQIQQNQTESLRSQLNSIKAEKNTLESSYNLLLEKYEELNLNHSRLVERYSALQTSYERLISYTRIIGPLGCTVGDEVTYKILLGNEPMNGIVAGIDDVSKITGLDGSVKFRFEEAGLQKITALDLGQAQYSYTLVYPKGNERIPIRGLRFVPAWNIPIHFMKMAGANFLYFKVWYVIDDEANIRPALLTHSVIPCSQDELENDAKKIISLARSYNLKIFLVPFLWRTDVMLDAPPEEKLKIFNIKPEYKTKFLDQLSKMTTRIAEFAEENNIEMLAPICELHLYLGYEASSAWHQEMLSTLREKYKGELVVTDQDYMSKYYNIGLETETIPNFNYSGYDYIGLLINPSGTKSWVDLEYSINKTLDYASQLREKYQIRVIISNVGVFGNADWMLEEYPDNWSKARANFFKVVLRLILDRVEGVFFNAWNYDSPSESVVSRVFIQSREPYDVVKEYFSMPYTDENELTSTWFRFIKDKEEALWRPIKFIEVERIFLDPQGDAAPNLDLKSIWISCDQNNVFIHVDFYIERPSVEVLFNLDVNSDGLTDYLIRTFPSGEAPFFKSYSMRARHQFLCMLNCTYDRNVVVKIPLEIIGYPQKLGLEAASWDEEKSGLADQFIFCNDMIWLVFNLPFHTIDG